MIANALWETSIEEIEIYIVRRQNTLEKFISTRTVMNLCLEAYRCPW